MENISDLQIGKAGEYLVCADLILNGHIAYPSEQGLPYDILADINNKLLKIQVKTTRKAKHIPQRKTDIPAYIFHIGINGRKANKKTYQKSQVDIFALVVLDTKRISYLPFFNHKTTMNFRVPELRGKYHDEQGIKNKEIVIQYKKEGYSAKEIAKKTGMKLSNVERYSSNLSIKQKGTNSGVYFDEFSLKKCLCQL